MTDDSTGTAHADLSRTPLQRLNLPREDYSAVLRDDAWTGELTEAERAARAESLAEGAGVDVAGYDPATGTYTEPAARAAEGPAARSGTWTAAAREAYLDSREQVVGYNPTAEYGDPDWREPASDEEAAARVAHLDRQAAAAPPHAAPPRLELTEVEDALADAAERATLADRAHDPDPQAWAAYERLLDLNSLTPLAHERDALDGDATEPDERVLEDYQRDHAALSGSDGDNDGDDIARGMPDGFDPGVTGLRYAPSAPASREHLPTIAFVDADDIEELRREQLTRWHDDDHGSAGGNDTDAASGDERDAGSGWGR